MKIIFDYNRTLFNPETDALYPGVLELLATLSERCELCLVSKNEPARKKRFKEFGIEKYFKVIAFVNEKSKQIFQEITVNEEDVLVVGDSIGSEIKVGNQLGFITIRVMTGKFATQVPKDEYEVAKYEVGRIMDVEKIIAVYEK